MVDLLRHQVRKEEHQNARLMDAEFVEKFHAVLEERIVWPVRTYIKEDNKIKQHD